MSESPVRLQFDKHLPEDLVNGRLAADQYQIVEKETNRQAGAIRLRVGNSLEIQLYAGNIGYNINEEYRGRRYATYACLELKSIALQRGLTEVWITCDPLNLASRRTCERIGAELVDIIDLPEDIDMYRDGERQKCRYRWRLK
ncbi:hypothetical protein GCM10028807_41860 [Spirosoma daeguense]